MVTVVDGKKHNFVYEVGRCVHRNLQLWSVFQLRFPKKVKIFAESLKSLQSFWNKFGKVGEWLGG